MIRAIKSQMLNAMRRLLAKRGYDLVSRPAYASETSKCRERLGRFCSGYGLDLGPGGDPINDTAIRVDLPEPYARVGALRTQLAGDAARLHWFQDGVLDYVYSSHLLEDFRNTGSVLAEWLRVLKPGGYLILFCPDEQIYRAHCATTGQPYNQNHEIDDFSLDKVKRTLCRIECKTNVIHENKLVEKYSWELVVEKTKE